MAAAMQADQSIYGLRCINLDGAGVSLSIEQLATSHLHQICKVQEHGPYQLIGYSFGGFVAYEMARQLVNRGENVGLLAMVDTVNPLFYRNLSHTEARRFRKTYFADRIRKYSRNLIQGRFDSVGSDASRLIGKKVKWITRKITQTLGQVLDRPLSNINPSLIVEEMSRSYTPKEFRGRLVLFRVQKALDGGSEFDEDPSLGWHKYANNGVDVQFVAGGHETVMQMPNVLDLANKLAPYLAEH